MEFEINNRPRNAAAPGRLVLSGERERGCSGRPAAALRSRPQPDHRRSIPVAGGDDSQEAQKQLAVVDPSQTLNIPVPLITIGKAYAPIPAGRLQAVPPEAMEAARHLGLGPMLAAAVGSADDPKLFWSVAALTDPVSASSVLQACTVGGRRVLFAERGAAESLARGKTQLVPARGGKGGLRRALDAFSPVNRLRTLWAALHWDAPQRGEAWGIALYYYLTLYFKSVPQNITFRRVHKLHTCWRSPLAELFYPPLQRTSSATLRRWQPPPPAPAPARPFSCSRPAGVWAEVPRKLAGKARIPTRSSQICPFASF